MAGYNLNLKHKKSTKKIMQPLYNNWGMLNNLRFVIKNVNKQTKNLYINKQTMIMAGFN